MILELLLLPSILDSLLRAVLIVARFLLPRRVAGGNREVRALLPASGAILLVAARDEEAVIGEVVRSLVGVAAEWPGSEVWVIADRCLDLTAEVAQTAGARVAVRNGGVGGKAAALNWWMREHETVWKEKAAVVILDADSRMDPGSLLLLGESLADGADAAQAFVTPLAGGSVGRLAGWSEELMQRIDDEARQRLGWPVPLRGCGMAIRSGLLAALAPVLHTQAEDLELDVLLGSRGARVDFVPGATLRDPKPQRLAGAARQRARWLTGQIDVLRDYQRELWAIATRRRRTPKRRSFAGDFFLFPLLFLRPKAVMILLRLSLLPLVPGLALIGLGLDAIYYLAGAAVVGQPRRYLLDLALAPCYLAVWAGGLLLTLLRRTRRTWLRAGR